LELRGGHETHLAARVLVARPVEAPELVVQDSREGQTQSPRARRQGRREDDATALGRLVERRDAAVRVPALPRDGRLADLELDRVQDDLRGRLGDLEGHGFLAREAERREIGFESQVVTGRSRKPGQAIRIHEPLRKRSGLLPPILYRPPPALSCPRLSAPNLP